MVAGYASKVIKFEEDAYLTSSDQEACKNVNFAKIIQTATLYYLHRSSKDKQI